MQNHHTTSSLHHDLLQHDSWDSLSGIFRLLLITCIRCLAAVASPSTPLLSAITVILSSTFFTDTTHYIRRLLGCLCAATSSAFFSFSAHSLSTSTHCLSVTPRLVSIAIMLAITAYPHLLSRNQTHICLLLYPCLCSAVLTLLPLEHLYFRFHHQSTPRFLARKARAIQITISRQDVSCTPLTPFLSKISHKTPPTLSL